MRRLLHRRMMRGIRYLLAAACLFLFAAASGAEGVPDRERDAVLACADTPVEVTACGEKDRRRICGAAEQAFHFFRQFGLSRRQPLRVNLCEERVAVGGGSVIGRYDRGSGEVKLLSFDSYRRQVVKDPPFDSPASEALYQSFGVHEIAHAIADRNFRVFPVPWLSQEYIAAVAQFAMMEPGLRNRILARYRLKAFKTTESMSILYYQLDPSAFAIKAYLHFLALDDQEAFLRDLLSGAVILGDDEDWLACAR